MDCSHQAPLFKGFSGQEYWSGLPCPPPGDLPNRGMEPASLMSLALAGGPPVLHSDAVGLCLFPLDDLEEYKLPGVCAPLQHYVLRCLVTVLPFISFSISLILRTQLLLFLFNLKEEMATHCSMFSQQQYWSGLPFPPPGGLSSPGITAASPASPALQLHSLPLSRQGSPCQRLRVKQEA